MIHQFKVCIQLIIVCIYLIIKNPFTVNSYSIKSNSLFIDLLFQNFTKANNNKWYSITHFLKQIQMTKLSESGTQSKNFNPFFQRQNPQNQKTHNRILKSHPFYKNQQDIFNIITQQSLQDMNNSLQSPQPSIYKNQKFRSVIDSSIGSFQPLKTAKIMFSCILNRHEGQLRMINKIKDVTPNLDFDWDMYLTFKAHARTMVTSGQVMRGEYQYKLFADYNAFYQKALLDYHKERNPDRQKIFILSNSLISDQEVKNFINVDCYQPILVGLENSQTEFKSVQKKNSLNGYLEQLSKNYPLPLLIECGLTTLGNYLRSQQNNLIDLLVIGEFDGELPEQSRGKILDFDFQEYYEVLYCSQPIKEKNGHYVYKVYGPKRRNE